MQASDEAEELITLKFSKEEITQLLDDLDRLHSYNWHNDNVSGFDCYPVIIDVIKSQLPF